MREYRRMQTCLAIQQRQVRREVETLTFYKNGGYDPAGIRVRDAELRLADAHAEIDRIDRWLMSHWWLQRTFRGMGFRA